MYSLFLIILGACCVVSYSPGRYAVAAVVLIGFLQDPFRKVIPGEPVIFVAMVGVVFAFVFVGIISRIGLNRSLAPFNAWSNEMARPLNFFVLVLVLQLLHSFLRYGNAVVSLIGLMSYVAPFFAIVVGYYSIDRIEDIRRFMRLYVVAGVLVSATVILSYTGYDSPLFKEVGTGLKIYDQGTILRSFSGLMRTGEIAAWHAATAACFMTILYFTSEKKSSLLVALVIVVLAVMAIVFTGRRKMLMLISMFSIFYLVSYFYFRKSLNFSYAVIIVIGLFFVWIGVEIVFPGGYSDNFQNYLARSTSVYSDAPSRFASMGLAPLTWAYNRVGLFGGGLGIASQGSAIFNMSSIAGGAGEGGLGKVMAELGLPGLIAIAWLTASIAIYLNKGLLLSSQKFVPKEIMPMMLGISAMLGVNVLTFSVATQVYGDVFILILLGLLAGFLFALPKLVLRGIDQQQAAQQSYYT